MRLFAALLSVGLACGCTAAPLPLGSLSGIGSQSDDDRLVPPGYGSLRQDDVTLTLDIDGAQLKVTPLSEWVIRLTAPDTWSRLSALANAHRDRVTRRAGEPVTLFLVSFFSRIPGTIFRPNDVELVNRGRRQRPLAISPVTPGWGSERLEQEETQVAIYAFTGDVDLDQSLTVEYDLEASVGWDEILRQLESERARALARAEL